MQKSPKKSQWFNGSESPRGASMAIAFRLSAQQRTQASRCVGCAGDGDYLRTRKLTSPSVSQARRLLSWLRSVPFGGCQAAQRTPKVRESYHRLTSRLRLRGPGLPPRRLPSPNVSQARTPALQTSAAFTLPLCRRRDACALCGAKRLRRLPGCAACPRRLPGCVALPAGGSDCVEPADC